MRSDRDKGYILSQLCLFGLEVFSGFLVNGGKSCHHVDMRYPHMLQQHHAIISRLVSKFRPYVTNDTPGQRLSCLNVSNWHDKGVWAPLFALSIKLCHDNRVVSRTSKPARPPLGRCQGRRIENKLLCGRIISRGSLKTLYIGALCISGFSECQGKRYKLIKLTWPNSV